MVQKLAVHALRKGDRFEFQDGLGPAGIHLVLIAWGVTGTRGPMEPWMVATRDAEGKIHNLTLDPYASVLCHDLRR
jgi:hypothetical protein